MLRSLALISVMLALLPLVVARPFVGILLWSWISFMNPHREIWGPATEMPWAAMVFCATALGCLVAGEPKRFTLNAVTALVLALMLCITITSVAALGPPAAVWDKWSRVFKVLLVLLLTAWLLTDRRRIHALVWIMVIAIGYYGVRAGVFSIMTAGAFRVYGPPQTMIADNNHVAAAMLVSLPLMNYLRLQSRHAAVRWGLAAAMALTLLATVTSYSRGALLGLAAVALAMLARSRSKFTTGAALAVCVAGAISFMPAQWADRMNSISAYEEDQSATTRLVLWEVSLKLALDRPLVGSGFHGPYTREVVDRVAPGGPARAVHSIWFETMGEHGFPTFAVWLGLTVAGLYYSVRLTRLARDRPDLTWAGDLGRMAQVSMVAYVVSGTFLSLSYWDFYWTLMVVVGAAHAVAAQTVAAVAGPRGAAPPAALGPAWRRPGAAALPPFAAARRTAADT